MTVKDLIEVLQKMPPDATVYYNVPDTEDCYGGPETPHPSLDSEGNVSL